MPTLALLRLLLPLLPPAFELHQSAAAPWRGCRTPPRQAGKHRAHHTCPRPPPPGAAACRTLTQLSQAPSQAGTAHSPPTPTPPPHTHINPTPLQCCHCHFPHLDAVVAARGGDAAHRLSWRLGGHQGALGCRRGPGDSGAADGVRPLNLQHTQKQQCGGGEWVGESSSSAAVQVGVCASWQLLQTHTVHLQSLPGNGLPACVLSEPQGTPSGLHAPCLRARSRLAGK